MSNYKIKTYLQISGLSQNHLLIKTSISYDNSEGYGVITLLDETARCFSNFAIKNSTKTTKI